jgi:YVTN family beta-propeller protein
VASFGFPREVKLIDPVTLRVTSTAAVGTSSTEFTTCSDGYPAMAESGGFLWVTNPVDGTISQIDVGSRRGVATVNVGKTPTGVAVAFGSVWVTVAGR